MTTTNELFLPSRIVYRVAERAGVLARFRGLRCMALEPSGRWTWNYEFEAKKMDFPPAYGEIPRERQPVVLASCYWVEPDRLHVYVRSTLRLTKFLVFFDERVPRSCARGEFFDEYNLLTTQDPRQPLLKPEDFFRDESRIVFFDVESMASDPAGGAELIQRQIERTLEPLERHRLTAFYEDGSGHMVYSMRLREMLAMEQYRSAEPIRPFEFLQRALKRSGEAPHVSPEADDLPLTGPANNLPTSVTVRPALGNLEGTAFSFLKWDPALDRDVIGLSSASGHPERYGVEFGCCDNPACDCRVLELWLRPLSNPGSSGPTRHLQLDTEARQVRCPLPAEDIDRGLAKELTTRFTPSDWALADRMYCSNKADYSEPADVRDLDTAFPQHVLTDPSLLMQYQEVFHHARHLRFEAAGRSWMVFELYCSNPDCACQEVFLDLVQLPRDISGNPKVVVKKPEVGTILYNYATADVSVRKAGPPGWPPVLELLAVLEAANPELRLRLQRRQRVLRQLHQNAKRNKVVRAHAPPMGPRKKWAATIHARAAAARSLKSAVVGEGQRAVPQG